MKIYFSHSKKINFQEMYKALRASELNKIHEIVLPHEQSMEAADFVTKDIIKDCDLVIAETTYSATGVGIELGWANAFTRKIICFHQPDAKLASSLKVVSNTFIEYKDTEDFIQKVEEFISK